VEHYILSFTKDNNGHTAQTKKQKQKQKEGHMPALRACRLITKSESQHKLAIVMQA
jgi:hypothetical protein